MLLSSWHRVHVVRLINVERRKVPPTFTPTKPFQHTRAVSPSTVCTLLSSTPTIAICNTSKSSGRQGGRCVCTQQMAALFCVK